MSNEIDIGIAETGEPEYPFGVYTLSPEGYEYRCIAMFKDVSDAGLFMTEKQKMNRLISAIIEAVKKFEEENPGVLVTKIDLDQYGNIAEQGDGSMLRINYLVEIETIGAESRRQNQEHTDGP